MRSKETLQRSYEKQKETFEKARLERLSNVRKQREKVSAHIERLSFKLNELTNLEEKIEKEQFQSFSDFFRKAQEQSNSKRTTSE